MVILRREGAEYYLPKGKGLVLMSLAFSGCMLANSGARIWVGELPTVTHPTLEGLHTHMVVSLDTPDYVVDWIESDWAGGVVTLSLPAGAYMMYALTGEGVGETTIAPLSVRFDVADGRFTYAGEIRLEWPEGSLEKGMKNCGRVGKVEISDQRRRDLAVYENHYQHAEQVSTKLAELLPSPVLIGAFQYQ